LWAQSAQDSDAKAHPESPIRVRVTIEVSGGEQGGGGDAGIFEVRGRAQAEEDKK